MPTTQYAVPVPPPGTTFPQATMTFTSPVIHTSPQDCSSVQAIANGVTDFSTSIIGNL